MTSQHKPVVLRKWKQALKLHCVSTPKNVAWNVAAKKKCVRYRGEKKSSKKSKQCKVTARNVSLFVWALTISQVLL